jgi:hypothetical protein
MQEDGTSSLPSAVLKLEEKKITPIQMRSNKYIIWTGAPIMEQGKIIVSHDN